MMIVRAPAVRHLRSSASWGSDQARDLLERNGLADVAPIFSRLQPERCRHEGRAVVETVLTAADGTPVRAFAKLYFGRRRWWPRMTDIKAGQAWQSLPIREWSGIERLGALGLLVPERLGLFREAWLRPRSALIIAAVPAPDSVDDLLRSGRWPQLASRDRESILEDMAAVTRRIHAAGLAWRGICCRHFFPVQRPGGGWQHWLIDLEGVHVRRGIKPITRDHRKLLRAMRGSGADEDTLASLAAKLEAAGS